MGKKKHVSDKERAKIKRELKSTYGPSVQSLLGLNDAQFDKWLDDKIDEAIKLNDKS